MAPPDWGGGISDCAHQGGETGSNRARESLFSSKPVNREVARERGSKSIWLITTNDNLGALRIYQRRDFRLVGVASNAVEESRKIKPQIPATGLYDIPIREEIELEVML